MIFNSYAFLAFFPIVTLAYYLLPMRARRPWLLAASYYFYMCWNAQYALLIAASTLVTYLCALALGRIEAKAGRRAVLALGLAINLGILCFFKYFGFLPIHSRELPRVWGCGWRFRRLTCCCRWASAFTRFRRWGI